MTNKICKVLTKSVEHFFNMWKLQKIEKLKKFRIWGIILFGKINLKRKLLW